MAQLAEALTLWRGRTFADVPATPAVAAAVARLEQRRLTALDLRLGAELDLGRHADVIDEQIPAAVDEAAAAAYRSHLADRRVLVLLDNAHHPEQIRPLLPGAAGCLALVTSRDRLGGLVARDGALPLAVDVLSPAESQALLVRLLGAYLTQALDLHRETGDRGGEADTLIRALPTPATGCGVPAGQSEAAPTATAAAFSSNGTAG